MGEGHTPGFEQPDVEELRQTYQRPSIWSRLAGFFGRIFTNRTTSTVLLFVLILAVLAGAGWLLGR